MPKHSKTFIDNVEKQLKSRDMNRARLAEAMELANPNITQLLRKETNPKLDMIEAVAHALGVEPWELLRPPKPALAPAPIPGLADLEKELRQLAQGKAAKLVESWLNQLRLVKGGLEEDELGDGPIENDPQGG